MGFTLFSVKFGNALWFRVYKPGGAIVQYKYLNRVYFDCKAKMCLIVPGRHGKYMFTQESFYLQGILNDIMNRTHFFLTVNTST